MLPDSWMVSPLGLSVQVNVLHKMHSTAVMVAFMGGSVGKASNAATFSVGMSCTAPPLVLGSPWPFDSLPKSCASTLLDNYPELSSLSKSNPSSSLADSRLNMSEFISGWMHLSISRQQLMQSAILAILSVFFLHYSKDFFPSYCEDFTLNGDSHH